MKLCEENCFIERNFSEWVFSRKKFFEAAYYSHLTNLILKISTNDAVFQRKSILMYAFKSFINYNILFPDRNRWLDLPLTLGFFVLILQAKKKTELSELKTILSRLCLCTAKWILMKSFVSSFRNSIPQSSPSWFRLSYLYLKY